MSCLVSRRHFQPGRAFRLPMKASTFHPLTVPTSDSAAKYMRRGSRARNNSTSRFPPDNYSHAPLQRQHRARHTRPRRVLAYAAPKDSTTKSSSRTHRTPSSQHPRSHTTLGTPAEPFFALSPDSPPGPKPGAPASSVALAPADLHPRSPLRSVPPSPKSSSRERWPSCACARSRQQQKNCLFLCPWRLRPISPEPWRSRYPSVPTGSRRL